MTLEHVYKLIVASYVFNILTNENVPTLRSLLYMSHPSYKYHTRIRKKLFGTKHKGWSISDEVPISPFQGLVAWKPLVY